MGQVRAVEAFDAIDRELQPRHLRAMARSEQPINVLLVGPAGTGKTHMASQVAGWTHRPLYSDQVDSGMMPGNLTESLCAAKGQIGLSHRLGVIYGAMGAYDNEPGICLLNDIHHVGDWTEVLYGALDTGPGGSLRLNDGSYVTRAPETMFIMTSNRPVTDLPEPVRDRIHAVMHVTAPCQAQLDASVDPAYHHLVREHYRDGWPETELKNGPSFRQWAAITTLRAAGLPLWVSLVYALDGHSNARAVLQQLSVGNPGAGVPANQDAVDCIQGMIQWTREENEERARQAQQNGRP